MEYCTTSQRYENGALTGYIFKSYKIDTSGAVRCLVTRDGKADHCFRFHKLSGKSMNIVEYIYLFEKSPANKRKNKLSKKDIEDIIKNINTRIQNNKANN